MELQRGTVALDQLHRRVFPSVAPAMAQQAHRQLAREIVELDAQHVHHMKLRTLRQAAGDAARQVPVHAGDLQGTPGELPAERPDGRIAQASEIPPQDHVHQPLPLEHVHRPRMQVGPPVGFGQVLRYRDLGREALRIGVHGPPVEPARAYGSVSAAFPAAPPNR
jgi:hypothetical protein